MITLIKPIVSEKAGSLITQGKYIFEVHPDANKSEVKKRVEKVFSVKVASVNVVNMPAKTRRWRGQLGKTIKRKKAIVTLVPGQSIQSISDAEPTSK